jgi:class 3 adenylate cyclase/tetratricopeptide (TPR) repeat protein
MTFEEILDQALAMLQRRGRVTYRTLKRQFQLDDDALEDLKEELIDGQQLAVDEAGKVLVWTGGVGATPAPGKEQARAPLAYTPTHLAEKILTSKSALEGERKQVTVLFADLKGSMELLADRDPEEARQLLDPVLDHMMEAVHRYEGTVNQVMGDGIMALFGAPIAHEDHAVRACFAALRMQETVTRYSDELQRSRGVPVQIRVGLNSGEVVVRSIGNDLHMDYTAVGQTTHLAARMEQMARPGSGLVTAETLRLAEGYVQAKPLGPVPVKGLAAPIEVFELIGAMPTRTRLQAFAARGLTRFVGRQAELEALRQALERAGAGHGQVIAVIGEPGVGKTRLLYEFTRSHRTHDWLLLESSSASWGKATAYLPIRDLLKGYFQIDDRDEERKVREKVAGKLVTLETALGPTLPAFLALLDVPVEDPQWQALDPPQRRQRTLDALKRLLLRESQVQPLLVVFENLHWIDAETQAFLDSLVESLPTAKILLLVNYRPEYQHGWGNKTYYTQLRLDPLSRASAEALLDALLGHDAGLQALKQRLIERTEGNPFFLEESVRTLVETQVLVGERGAYRLAPNVGAALPGRPQEGDHRGLPLPPEIHLPPTVQAVLAARIDRLPAEEKRLLQTAAVIGTEVPFPLLQAIAELPEEALHRGLAHLQTAEFLYESHLFPELEYTFKHALTHEVAYGSFLQERRRALHTRIVEAIETLYPDRLGEQVERLAHHALRGEIWDKALVYFRQAGTKAFARSANREAVACFEQALAALKRLPENRETTEQAIDLRFDLRNALHPLGEFGRILDHLREAEPRAEALDDRHRLGRVSSLMANYFLMVGDPDRTIESGQRVLGIAMALGDFSLEVVAHLFLGQAYHSLGDYWRATDFFRRNVASLEGELLHERFGLIAPVSMLSRAFLVWCLAEVGAFPEGIARGEEAVRIAEGVDHPFSLIYAYSGVGRLYLCKADFHRAISVLERGLGLCQGANIPLLFPRVASALGSAYALSGRVAQALPLLEQAVEQAAAMSLLAHQSLWLVGLSEGHLLAGRIEEAIQTAERALELSREHKEQGYQAWTLRLLGEIAAQRDPHERGPAEASYRQALALANDLDMRPLQAHCHLGLGTLYVKTGQREQARTELFTAIELYRDMDMTFWLPQVEAALAQVEGR